MSAKPKRRWYQFTLKTMLGVITALCVGPGGYVAYEQHKARTQKAAVEAIEKAGFCPFYDREVPRRSELLRWLLGDDSYANVVGVNFSQDHLGGEIDLRDLKPFPRLKWLYLPRTRVTDADLADLKLFPRLKGLLLFDTAITDAGLVHLDGLSDFNRISLSHTRVTDAGLVHLVNLYELQLNGTKVTDAGLEHLARSRTLRRLCLSNTLVTDAGVEKLQRALPNLEIFR